MTLEVIKNENSILVTDVYTFARRYGLFRKIRLYIILIALRGNDQRLTIRKKLLVFSSKMQKFNIFEL